MITPSAIYWITRFDDIRSGLGTTAFVAVALAVLTVVGFLSALEDVSRDNEMKFIKVFFAVAAAFMLLAGVLMGVRTFVPTTRDAAAMAVLPALANSEKVQTVGNAVYDLAVEWLEELKPVKKEERK